MIAYEQALTILSVRIMKILIIEDDPEIVEAVHLALETRWPDAHLVSAHLGMEGVQLSRQEAPDIVLLDLGLPDVSGFQVLKEIRRFSTVPIVILTASFEEANVCRALKHGATDFVAKPCDRGELISRLEAAMRD